jgi:hypothetical protein
MRRVVSVVSVCASLALGAAACGGPPVPQHSGYKNDKSTPWTKPHTLKFSDKFEAKADGTLDYAKYNRAKWFALDLPSHGDLDVHVDINPPGDAVNEEFDLGVEIYDPNLRVIAKADAEDEGAGELNKKKSLKDLNQGRYLVHLYLEGRMDTADYTLGATFHSTAASPNDVKTDFPAQVMFPTPLAQVPLQDEAPASYKPPKPEVTHVTVIHGGHRPPPPPPPVKTVAPAAVSARIVGLSVVSGGTQITVGRGTDTGAANGMKVLIKGVPGGGVLANCTPRVCTAVISATPDQINGAKGEVTIAP